MMQRESLCSAWLRVLEPAVLPCIDDEANEMLAAEFNVPERFEVVVEVLAEVELVDPCGTEVEYVPEFGTEREEEGETAPVFAVEMLPDDDAEAELVVAVVVIAELVGGEPEEDAAAVAEIAIELTKDVEELAAVELVTGLDVKVAAVVGSAGLVEPVIDIAERTAEPEAAVLVDGVPELVELKAGTLPLPLDDSAVVLLALSLAELAVPLSTRIADIAGSGELSSPLT